MQHRGVPIFCALVLSACASAGTTAGDDDDTAGAPDARTTEGPDAEPIEPHPDARPDDPPIDAMPIDAAPLAITLSQNNATNLVAGNSIACANNTTGFTAENSFYRVFDLTAMGVDGQFTATSVTFGIETSTAHTLDVRLHRLTGAFTLANLTQLHTQAVPVAAVPTSAPALKTVTLSTPVVVPAGSKLVAEIHSPDLRTAAGQFYIGSNTAGETGASYTYASTCGDTQPLTMAQNGFPTVHIVLTVSGTAP